jgi:hypothetical protein
MPYVLYPPTRGASVVPIAEEVTLRWLQHWGRAVRQRTIQCGPRRVVFRPARGGTPPTPADAVSAFPDMAVRSACASAFSRFTRRCRDGAGGALDVAPNLLAIA